MKYLIYTSHELADQRSYDIADEQACTNDVTTHWFGIVDHPTSGESAMQISEGEEDKLTQQEQSELVLQQFMDDNGWFPLSEEVNLTQQEQSELVLQQYLIDNGWFTGSYGIN